MKKSLFLLPVAAGAAFLLSFTEKKSVPVPAPKPIQTLIIDPGHGGQYPGARGSFSRECDVTLSVALKLGAAIQKEFPNIKVVFTRTTDANAGFKSNLNDDLHYRANIANESGGDLFISIHCNSAGRAPGGWYGKKIVGYTTATKKVKVKKKWVTRTVRVPRYENFWIENVAKGTETYVWAVGKNDSKINAIDNNADYGEVDSLSTVALPDPNDPAEKARMLIYAQNYFRKSLTLADFIEKEFINTGRISRGVKQRNDKGIWVLQATGMPSVLVEIGFISNKSEEQYINSDEGQAQIVEDIVSGFRNYKQKFEAKAASQQADQ